MRACNYRGFFAVYGESLVESASSSRLAVMSGVRVRGVRCNTCNLILTVVDRCRGAQLRTDSLHGICENQSFRLRVEGLYRCFVAMYVTDRVKYHTRARARTYASTHARTHARTHAHTHTLAHTHAHTNTHTRAHIRTQHARVRARTHTQIHIHAHIHT